MNNFILIALILNLLVSVIFCIWHIADKSSKVWLIFFFLLLPVFGYLLYYLPMWVASAGKLGEYDRDSLIRRMDVEKSIENPQIEKELNIIPISDAMAAGTNQEKRFLLLEQLKKNIHQNYKAVLPAAKDSDSESAHYVAAAKMEAYRHIQQCLKTHLDELSNNPEHPQVLCDALKIFIEYINSELISEKELKIYQERYCVIFEAAGKDVKRQIEPGYWAAYLSYLAALGKPEKAEQAYAQLSETQKDETVYLELLKMYYAQRNHEKFYRCLDELKRSPVRLTADGLKLLRYWEQRRLPNAVH